MKARRTFATLVHSVIQLQEANNRLEKSLAPPRPKSIPPISAFRSAVGKLPVQPSSPPQRASLWSLKDLRK